MTTAQQLDLFDARPLLAVIPDTRRAVDLDALDDLAFLYTATSAGNNSGIRFMMSLVDAMAWCQSPKSRGIGRGAEWAFFWTTVPKFLTCYEGPSSRFWRLDLSQCVDDGRCDADIAALGLTKIGLDEIAAVLTPMGVEVSV